MHAHRTRVELAARGAALVALVLLAACGRSVTSSPTDPSNLEKWAAEVKKRPDPDRRKQPLEEFPLDALDMVGTIGTGAAQVALVMAPDKVTYRVRSGMYMGQSEGRVTAVSSDRVDLVELIPDGSGGWMERPASITLDEQ